MNNLSDVELFLAELPTLESAGPSPDATSNRVYRNGTVRVLVVRLADSDGREGWGEAPTSWRPGEIAARREWLLPSLAGRGVFDVEELLTLDVLRFAPLRTAVETAAWDLIGRTLGQPLCRLWGGEYRRQVPLVAPLPIAPPDDTARMAREFADAGFFVHQLSAVGEATFDAARCSAWRQAAGSGTALRVDGRNRFTTIAAVEFCRELESCELQRLFDPIASADTAHLASLARQSNVPLGAGSAVGGPRDIAAIARHEVVRHVDVRLERVGGLAIIRKCAAAAEAFGLSLSISTLSPLGPAAAGLLHTAAATANLAQAALCLDPRRPQPLLEEPIAISDGAAQVPTEPGLGIRIDRAKLDDARMA